MFKRGDLLVVYGPRDIDKGHCIILENMGRHENFYGIYEEFYKVLYNNQKYIGQRINNFNGFEHYITLDLEGRSYEHYSRSTKQKNHEQQ